MREYRDILEWTAPENGCALTLGRFDGVHLGHRALLERAVEHARHHDLVPVCFSFQEQTYPGAKKFGQLTTEEEKADIMAGIGIEVLLHPTFAVPLIEMSAADFIHTFAIQRWHVKLIVVGYDFRFGKDREGNTSYLKEEGEKHGIEIEIFEPFNIEGHAVKATTIRELISTGKVEKARVLLGRNYSIRVSPQVGRGLGRKIGFPTINFSWPGLKVKPLPGIYAVTIESGYFTEGPLGGKKRKLNGVANFGFQPTIDESNREPVFEVHILDDVPEKITSVTKLPQDSVFTVEFVEFIREERKFDSIDELREQIAKDCEKAREILQGRYS